MRTELSESERRLRILLSFGPPGKVSGRVKKGFPFVPHIAPFRALRFRERVCGPMGSVLATAYDAVDGALTRKLLAASAYNVLRLELPVVSPGPDQDKYEAAADMFKRWQAEDAITPDPEPAYYVLGHDFVHMGRRLTQLGLVCLCILHDWADREILPHERTLPGQRAGRLRHLQALRATFRLGILVARDPARELRAFLEEVARGPALATVQRNWFEGHRLWRVEADALPAAARDAVQSGPLYMGDGHHRYEAALDYRRESSGTFDETAEAADSTTPPEATPKAVLEVKEQPGGLQMAYIVSATDPGLLVLGAHRVINVNMDALGMLERAGWEVAERCSTAEVLRTEQMAYLQAADLDGDPRLWLVGGQESHLLTLPPAALSPWECDERSPLWNRQESSLLDRQLLRELDGQDEPNVTYTRNARLAVDLVQSGRGNSALLMPSVSLDQVMALADAGDILPAKTTHFFPKPPAGFLVRSLDVV